MKFNKTKLFFLVFLIAISQGNPFLQFLSIAIFGILGLLFIRTNKIFYSVKDYFYIALIGMSLFQVLLFFKQDYSINYIVNSVIIGIMWALMALCSIVTLKCIKSLNNKDVHQILLLFFYINISLMILQYIQISIRFNSIMPFFKHMGSGDYLKGVFTNSSVNMIINSFYLIYFVFIGNKVKAILSLLGLVLTTYMSGVFLFLSVCVLYTFLYLKLKIKVRIIAGVVFGVIAFGIISPRNINYVKSNLTKKLFSKTDPARKVVSFQQTFLNSTTSFSNFIFGSGGGKFSSRTAFMTSGDYVSWFPKSFVYSSQGFLNNHFTLWNSELLSKPYKDGTANQPFSFYNKIYGEYGIIGITLFLMFYLYYIIKYYSKMSYGRIIFLLMLSYFILDYWFEYFTVIVFFELFIYLNIETYKRDKINETV